MMHKYASCIAIVVLLCFSTCACSPDADNTSPSNPSSSASTSVSSASVSAAASVAPSATTARLAASLQDYFTQIYDDEKDSTAISDEQKEMLKRAMETGEVSAADYEAAWSSYKTCMTDAGYSKPVLRKFPNGVYQEAGIDSTGGTDEQEKQRKADDARCWASYVMAIDQEYKVQVGNQNLYQDSSEAIVDCLHKAGVIPVSYTVERYKDEREAHFSSKSADPSEGYSFNVKDPQVRGCLAANNTAFTDFNDPNEEIWYPYQK